MSLSLIVFLLFLVIGFLAFIVVLLRKGELSLKYSLLWIFASIVLFVMLVWPGLLSSIASFVGIEAPSNLVFILEGVFVLVILISITVIVSKQSNRIVRLTQSIAVLEKRVRDLEAGKKNNDETEKIAAHVDNSDKNSGV